MEYRLLHQAHTDPLTGVANRRTFFEAAAREVRRSLRHGPALSLAVLDVDLFKNVNDRFGHDAGDAVLRLLAGAVERRLRLEDLLGRIGGEEFGILLPETSLGEALTVAERVRAAASEVRVPSEYAPLYEEAPEPQITVSLGVAALREEDENIETLYRRADQALYRAKTAGRNQVFPEESSLKPVGRHPQG
jgi:diguanylate cyclase (GGDEF)-like protein